MSATELVKVGSTFIDVLRAESAGWVLVKPLCDKLGIGYEAQRKRLQTSSWSTTSIFEAVAADGKVREMFCLRVDCVGMWLATLDGLRIKNETVRSMIRELQAEARDALDRWFRGPDTAPPAPALPPVRPVAPALWTAGDSSSIDVLEHIVRAMRNSERAQAELTAGVAQANQQSQTALAKVDQLIAENQAADLVLETPPRAPKVLAPDITSQVLTGRIVRSYGMLTRDYQGGWNIVYLNHRDTYHIDIKQLAKNDGVTPAEKATELERWEYLYAMAVKYLSPKIAEIRAARMSVARSYNA